MNNSFMTALAAGLESAKNTAYNKSQIDKKIIQISEMIFEGTNKKVELVLERDKSHNATIVGDIVHKAIVKPAGTDEAGQYITTLIVNDKTGFPVIIEASGNRYHCSSLEEMDLAFAEIVQSLPVANIIYHVMEKY